jgi:hypothetical protein
MEPHGSPGQTEGWREGEVGRWGRLAILPPPVASCSVEEAEGNWVMCMLCGLWSEARAGGGGWRMAPPSIME